MTTTAIPRGLRPVLEAVSPDMSWFRRVDWHWWLMRVPMVLLAAPAAYGVGAYAGEHLPAPFNQIAGMAFETAYIGAIAMADQQHEEQDQWSIWLWWIVNIGAVVASVLCNLLFVSGGRFANVRAESFVHAAPLPVLGFLYGLLLHRITAKNAVRQAKEAKELQLRIAQEEAERKQREVEEAAERKRKADQEEADRREYERANQFKCEWCPEGFATKKARSGHYSRRHKAEIQARNQHEASTD